MNAREPMPVPPPHPFTDEEREQASLSATPLKDHVFRNTLRFILGERDLSEWDTYIAELEGWSWSRRRTSASKARTADRS